MADLTSLAVEWTSWENTERAEVKTWQDAEVILEKMASQARPPCLVEFYTPATGQSLGLGIGRDTTIVTYQDSLDPPYFISLGNKALSGTEWFCYGNEQTEYLAKSLVPMDQGMAALKYFLEYRTQPKNLDWERL